MNRNLTTVSGVMIAGLAGWVLANARLQAGIDYAALLGTRNATAGLFATKAFGSPLHETISVAADKLLPNSSRKRLISLVVDYPPGASSASNRHSRSAIVFAYVLSGEIRYQVDSKPPRIYRAGESWLEHPDARYVVNTNASKTNPAKLLAVFILDADADQPTTSEHP